MWNIEKRYILLFYECFVAQFSCFSLGWPVTFLSYLSVVWESDGIGENGEEVLWWWKHIVVGILIKNGGPSLGGVRALYAGTGHRYFDVCVRVSIAVYWCSVTDPHMGIDRNERVKYVRNCTNNIDFLNHNCESYLDHRFRSYHVFVSLAVTN